MAFPICKDERLEAEIDRFVEEVANSFNKEIVEAGARATGFVERESKLTGFLFLSIFTFGMSIYGTPTLEELIGLLKRVVPELKLTRQGLHERINGKAVEFFEYMLSQAIQIRIPNIEVGVLEGFKKVLIADSTSFELPESLAEVFRGSGGDASEAAVKIQFCYDLKSAQFFYQVEEGVCPDNRYDNSFINQVNKEDLIIKDLGYYNTQVFMDISRRGGYYLSRLKTGVTLYKKEADEPLVVFDLMGFLRDIEGSEWVEVEVFLRQDDESTKTRLVIRKVPEEVKNERLRKINKANQKKGRKTSPATKVLQGFNLYISNTSQEKLAKEQFGILYGTRWQVELIFKNWKSNFKLDKVSGMREERIKCMLYAKLLFIFISTKIIYLARNFTWLQSKKEVSEYRAGKQLIIMARTWLELLIKQPEQIKPLLIDTIDFITTHCIKIKQKNRVYPLELLDKMF